MKSAPRKARPWAGDPVALQAARYVEDDLVGDWGTCDPNPSESPPSSADKVSRWMDGDSDFQTPLEALARRLAKRKAAFYVSAVMCRN